MILDNLGSHKGKAVRKAIRDVGARLVFLPKHSPDLNPIEQVFAKFKTLLRKATYPHYGLHTQYMYYSWFRRPTVGPNFPLQGAPGVIPHGNRLRAKIGQTRPSRPRFWPRSSVALVWQPGAVEGEERLAKRFDVTGGGRASPCAPRTQCVFPT